MKKIIGLLLAVAAVLLLNGCQPTPETETVTSKNDGTLEASIFDTKDTDADTDGEESPVVITDEFTSTDNTISYTLDIETTLTNDALPVLQVTPHTLTSEEAERAARAIFGDADLYTYTQQLSKGEIEDAILSLKQAVSDRDALLENYEGDETLADLAVANYEARISEYEAAYNDAPEAVESALCDWTFHPRSYYEEEVSSDGMETGADDIQCIKATTTMDGFPYIYNVYNKESDDERIHAIYTYIDDISVQPIEMYSTKEPTNQDLEEYEKKAKNILNSMELGDWEIGSSDVESWEDYDSGKTVYRVNVYATPIYDGVQVTYCEQLNLGSDDSYASDYYYEQAHFIFSGSTLVSLECVGFLDVVEELNDNVEILSPNEIVDVLKTQLRLRDSDYSMGASGADVDVNQLVVGLSRIRIQNNESDFYLVPTYTFYSDTTLLDENGEPIIWYDANDEVVDGTITERIMTINAVDGSIIDVSKGY